MVEKQKSGKKDRAVERSGTCEGLNGAENIRARPKISPNAVLSEAKDEEGCRREMRGKRYIVFEIPPPTVPNPSLLATLVSRSSPGGICLRHFS